MDRVIEFSKSKTKYVSSIRFSFNKESMVMHSNKCLLDTGCAITTIPISILLQNDISIETVNNIIDTINGKTVYIRNVLNIQ